MDSTKNYYQNVAKLIKELKDAKKQISKMSAALEVASRKLGLDTQSILRLESEPIDPTPSKDLTGSQKHSYYEEEYKNYLFNGGH